MATLFGSTGGVSASGRPATKTAGQRRNVVDDDDAAVRLVSLVQIRRDRSLCETNATTIGSNRPPELSPARARARRRRSSEQRADRSTRTRVRLFVRRAANGTGLHGGGRDRGERREASRDGGAVAARRARRAARTGQGGGRGRVDVQQTEARHEVMVFVVSRRRRVAVVRERRSRRRRVSFYQCTFENFVERQVVPRLAPAALNARTAPIFATAPLICRFAHHARRSS